MNTQTARPGDGRPPASGRTNETNKIFLVTKADVRTVKPFCVVVVTRSIFFFFFYVHMRSNRSEKFLDLYSVIDW